MTIGRGCLPTCTAIAVVLLRTRAAAALDKQGSAHAGSTEGANAGVHVSASVMAGLSIYNPSYAARPDNTGLALMRYAGHADVDLVGRRLSIPIDVNVLSDRQRTGLGEIAPSELDVITGLTSTWDTGAGAVEIGARFERDAAVDREGPAQSYVDARARYLFSAAALTPSIADALARGLRGGDVTATATLGWFVHNPSYFARPDNTGRALLRYAARVELAGLQRHLAVAVDATTFTDGKTNAIRPSELDLTPELIGRLGSAELHVAYERDLPLDDRGARPGYTQQFVYVLLAWALPL